MDGDLVAARHPSWFGNLRRVRREVRWCCGGSNLLRTNLGLAPERNAFLHCEPAGADVAEELRIGFNLDLIVGDDIAVDLTAHHHDLRVDVAVDHGAIAQVQSTVRLDFSIYFFVTGQFSRQLESTRDFYARVQEILGCFSASQE